MRFPAFVLIAGFIAEGICVAERPGQAATAKAVPYIRQNGEKWMNKRKCVSCHQITSMLWSVPGKKKQMEKWTKWAAQKTGGTSRQSILEQAAQFPDQGRRLGLDARRRKRCAR
tara:strand:+ start:235 stop:576 length:342 start_codon:yes stop_codon:yes gene_type:complete